MYFLSSSYCTSVIHPTSLDPFIRVIFYGVVVVWMMTAVSSEEKDLCDWFDGNANLFLLLLLKRLRSCTQHWCIQKIRIHPRWIIVEEGGLSLIRSYSVLCMERTLLYKNLACSLERQSSRIFLLSAYCVNKREKEISKDSFRRNTTEEWKRRVQSSMTGRIALARLGWTNINRLLFLGGHLIPSHWGMRTGFFINGSDRIQPLPANGIAHAIA